MNSVTSENVGALAAALAKFQGEAENITKGNKATITSQKGNFSYTYADLGAILTAIRKPLSKVGLALLQSPMSGEHGYELVTKLIHAESGEWAQSVLALPVPPSADVKAVGSAITYARRYALISLLGLATDDDDGSAASESRQRHVEQGNYQRRYSPPPPRASVGDLGEPDGEFPPDPPDGAFGDAEPEEKPRATGKQLAALAIAVQDHGMNDREVVREFFAWLVKRPITSSKELTKSEASRVIGWSEEQWEAALVDYALFKGGPDEEAA